MLLFILLILRFYKKDFWKIQGKKGDIVQVTFSGTMSNAAWWCPGDGWEGTYTMGSTSANVDDGNPSRSLSTTLSTAGEISLKVEGKDSWCNDGFDYTLTPSIDKTNRDSDEDGFVDCDIDLGGWDGVPTIIGGLEMKGKEEDDVNVKHLTISQSKGNGVLGNEGMSFHLFHLKIEKSEGYGVYVIGTKRNTMSNCQVSHSKYSGVYVNGGLITINGSGTSIHNNVTGGDSWEYGLKLIGRTARIEYLKS